MVIFTPETAAPPAAATTVPVSVPVAPGRTIRPAFVTWPAATMNDGVVSDE